MLTIFNESKNPIISEKRRVGDEFTIKLMKELGEGKRKNIYINIKPEDEKETDAISDLSRYVEMEKPVTLIGEKEKLFTGVQYDSVRFFQTIRSDFKNGGPKDIFILNLEYDKASYLSNLTTVGCFVHNYFNVDGTLCMVVSIATELTKEIKFTFHNSELNTQTVYTFSKNSDNTGYDILKTSCSFEGDKAPYKHKIKRHSPLKVYKHILVKEEDAKSDQIKNKRKDNKTIKTFKDIRSLKNLINDLKKAPVSVVTLYAHVDETNTKEYKANYKNLYNLLSKEFIMCNVLIKNGKVKKGY